MFYRILEESYSYDQFDEKIIMKEDVIVWADDVAFMMNEEDGWEYIKVTNIEEAIEILESANEFLEKVEWNTWQQRLYMVLYI